MNSTYKNPEILFDIVDILGQQNDFREILRLLTAKARSIFKAGHAAILMVNPQTSETIKTVINEGSEKDQKSYHILHTNIIGFIMKYKQSFLSPVLQKDSRFQEDLFSHTDVHSVMGVPLKTGGTFIGYFLVMNQTGDHSFHEGDLSFFEKLANLSAPFLSNTKKIQEYFQPPLTDDMLIKRYLPFGLLGKSRSFIELLNAVEAAARCDARILLEGQSGTGKELIARAIHFLSHRKNAPFIAIDCGAIPDNLIESELFGHVKGAFTGAINDHKGLIAEAHNGTLFMDEIANLPFDMQSKLLRVLQENEIRPVGGNETKNVNIRIIAASSTPLSELVENKKFREDLFYRLYVYPIYIPTLNNRRDDITCLANFFLNKFSTKQKKECTTFHSSIIHFMEQRSWNGNIRELENFVERLVILAPADMKVINPDLLPADIKKEFNKLCLDELTHPISKSLNETLSDYEEKIIRQTLMDTDWNQSKTARILRVSEQTIRYKMTKYSIVRNN